jgi:hypothetical protein
MGVIFISKLILQHHLMGIFEHVFSGYKESFTESLNTVEEYLPIVGQSVPVDDEVQQPRELRALRIRNGELPSLVHETGILLM